MTRPWSTALAALVLWIVCGGYASRFIDRGWIPHDEGTIGQGAERVLNGQLPHRDFDELYTGGLTYLHAAGMKALGVTLQVPRLILFVCFMAFLASVYAIAGRIAPPAAALVTMALAAVWSAPNYFVSLPSWYNLFFASFGVLAFLRHLESGHTRWLVAAGVCGGLSILAKTSGVFYVAGGLLYLAYFEHRTTVSAEPTRAQAPGYRIVVATVAAGCLVLVTALVAAGTIRPALVPLFLPAMLAGLYFTWIEWTSGSGHVTVRLRRFGGFAGAFLAGAAVPLLAFVFVYWQQDAIPDLVRGLFVLPQRRLDQAAWNPPGLATMGLAAPYAFLLIARRPDKETSVALALSAALGLLLLFGGTPTVHTIVTVITRSMTLVGVIAGLWWFGATPRVFLLVTMASMVALVQFPYATPTYFFYAAPMTILAILAVIYAQPQPPLRLHLSVAAFFLIFGIVFANRSYAGDRDVTTGFAAYHTGAALELERARFRVPARDKETYERVVQLLESHASGGTIYAGPDAPEIYFLSGFQNPTPAVFDFLTAARQDAAWMEALLARAPVRVVVINTAPRFSPPMDHTVVELLEKRFPLSERVGRFVVRFTPRD